mmetsp:Transcript_49912/g.100497  ORF Transcript_49912/g.100497 Transcript_49912/m.100497 type:complete len:495 (+) Transcript_49912:69-1553(+)
MVSPILILAAVIVFIALFLMWLGRRPKNSPPVVLVGLPVVGNFIEFGKDQCGFILDCYHKYGPCYSMGMMGQNLTFLVGPDVSAAFFAAKDEELSQPEVYGFMKPVFGANVVYDAAPKVRKQQMSHMTTGLATSRLKAYIPMIVAETEQFFKEHWGESGEVDILQALSDLTILTASRCLHGKDVRENLFAEVSHLYHDLDKGITPLSFFFPNLPTANHKKRDDARVKMVELFGGVIKARRADPEASKANTDILQVFIDMVYKKTGDPSVDGQGNTDDQIVGLLIALLFAGQHTSSITSTWTTLFLHHDPALLKRALAEIEEHVPKDAALTYEHVMKLDLMHNSVKEALRLHPPLIMLMRKAKVDIPVKADKPSPDGRTSWVIPKGDIVFTSPAVAGRLPSVWTRPDTFDPDRFVKQEQGGREEDKGAFKHLGFGGGMHGCLGQQFGYLQVKAIVATLLRLYELEPLSDSMPKPNYEAMVVGPKGSPMVRFKRRK